MSTEVSKSRFKARALEYFRDVERSGEPRLEVRRFTPQARSPLDILRGSVLRYDRPTDPVGEDDWDAAR